MLSNTLFNFSQQNLENNFTSVSALIPHDAISITDDDGFNTFPGIGTVEDPYIIEGYNITTSSSKGIEISGTTKYFVIKNCYINALDYGINIDNVAYGTATITNNTCENHNYSGIYLFSSSGSTISSNNCSYNDIGIDIYFSSTVFVTANNCSSNSIGVQLFSSSFSTINVNNCSYNSDYGIHLKSNSNNNSATFNQCNNNDYSGFRFSSSSNYNSISKNNCSYNSYFGIYLDRSDSNIFSLNNFQNNSDVDIFINSLTSNNLIYLNVFDHNHPFGFSQCYDIGDSNQWFEPKLLLGNFWSNWAGSGHYIIEGSSQSFDAYPSEYPSVYPIISSIYYNPTHPTDLETITISAIVYDLSGIFSVTLFYRVNASSWITTSMYLVADYTYETTIGPFSEESFIEYYVSAIDNSVNHSETIDDNSSYYYSFIVNSSLAIPEFQPFSLLFLSCNILLSSFVIIRYNRKKT
ncbi:MAG: NosD domain-containing protein [Candidatus Heimdallarchaeaceae archaeon]